MPHIPRQPSPRPGPKPEIPEVEVGKCINPTIDLNPTISIKDFQLPPGEAYRLLFGKEPDDGLRQFR